ncbi:hypothetical protein LTR37_007815 [Vermiconidia calcicola]|uniref:Uncharacterized protein n=1 Tax=Vermiconidia calcicola TaxID=1690605 RepID=A0ACC3NDV9_9PEZI|nr:hypothetical protein LTR37_007815 [Vermiconidia calcicola]
MLSFLERILLLPSAVLTLTLSHALAEGFRIRDTESTTVAAPISISPSEQWDGIDGSWSSFTLRIGTPPQDVRTLVSWNGYQTWGVLPDGCLTADDYNACAQSRGGLYNQTASNTFEEKGIFDFSILQDLGYYGNGQYGFDVVELGENGPLLENTTVAGFALQYFWMGVLGLNPKPTNFSSRSDGAPSYITQLKEQEYIPSISFGYTAGAQYREDDTDDAFASLTLGGYDATKFVENDRTWTFAPDNYRDTVVAIQSIFTSSQIDSNPVPTELLPKPISAYLDATVPHIWLPIESCYVFEYEFGLVYDNDTELYLVNNTLHQQLLNRNASITFQLAVSEEDEENVLIELPYAAFDLTAEAPYQGVTENTYYFPLRRAVNESQITLGRTFFQEAYITVDYESQKFNVSQRDWSRTSDEHLVAVPAYSAKSTYPGVGVAEQSSGSDGLSAGAIAGIVVGVVAVLALLGGLLLWYLRRRRLAAKRTAAENEKLVGSSDTGSTDNANAEPTAAASTVQQGNVIPKAELPGSAPLAEQELDDTALLSAGAVSSQYSDSNGNRTPRTPNAHSGSTFGFGRWNSVSQSPSTNSPVEGSGTHSSTGSNSHGTGTGSGTVMSVISPLSPLAMSEADSKEHHIYEMAGDMPTVKEKDGKLLSEKEALAHREKVYNGVGTVPDSPTAGTHAGPSREPPQRVNPEDVVTSDTVIDEPAKEERDFGRHRAFSFEDSRPDAKSSEELYERFGRRDLRYEWGHMGRKLFTKE